MPHIASTPARVGGVGVEHPAVAQRRTRSIPGSSPTRSGPRRATARKLYSSSGRSSVDGHVEVEVEVAVVATTPTGTTSPSARGRPRSPAAARARRRCTSRRGARGARAAAVDVVGDRRAARRRPLRPRRPNMKWYTTSCERPSNSSASVLRAVLGVSNTYSVVDLDPGQRLPLLGELVGQAGQLLLALAAARRRRPRATCSSGSRSRCMSISSFFCRSSASQLVEDVWSSRR